MIKKGGLLSAFFIFAFMETKNNLMHYDNAKGLTLIEILVALSIIAILSAIAIPMYTGYIRSSKAAEAKTNLMSVRLLVEQYNSDNGKPCPASSCTGSYTYTEDDTGAVTAQTIVTSYLTGFRPKSAATTTAVLYNYSLAFTSNTAYTITAAPVTSRGAPSGSLTINQDGTKTGW